MADRPFELIIDLPLSSACGTAEEISTRDAFANAVGNGFKTEGLGELSATVTAGGGKYNVWLDAIRPERWDAALAFALAELERHRLLAGAVVAQFIRVEEPDEDDPDGTIVWPPDLRSQDFWFS